MGLLLHLLQQGPPVANSVPLRTLQADVRRGCEQAILQVLAKAIGDGESNDERRDTGRHSDYGDRCDNAYNRLATFGAQVARGNEELEGHWKAEY